MPPEVELCGIDGCRRIRGHAGQHAPYPELWTFFTQKDKKKIGKAGFATPRGGAKNAYQNHVVRSNKVIIPFGRLGEADLSLYEDGYVIRLLPEQYFESAGNPRGIFLGSDQVVVGTNAFVLYRTHDALRDYPPLDGWRVRSLSVNGEPVQERSRSVQDDGHYVLRLASTGTRPARDEGPPQGIFAPEYANDDQNYLAKCVLAWLIITSYGSPYTTDQAHHLRSVLDAAGLADFSAYESRGVLRHGLTSCPLCLRIVRYEELHSMVSFEEEAGLANAAIQVTGATRSTKANLFHLIPLVYGSLQHVPEAAAWGHANCNTKLGQRRCYSLSELQAMNLKVGILRKEGVDTIGWISSDYTMIRSPMGAVWIRLSDDMPTDGLGVPMLTGSDDVSIEDTD